MTLVSMAYNTVPVYVKNIHCPVQRPREKQTQSSPYSAELSFGFDYINWITNGPCIFTVFLILCSRRLVKREGMHMSFSLSKRNLQQQIDLVNVFSRKHTQNVL